MIRNVKKYGGDRIAYVDLFCGPGRYEDGSQSTPLLLLDLATKDEEISQRLETLFMDERPDYVKSLSEEIEAFPGIESLAYKPRVEELKVSDSLASSFERKQLPPTLLFLDPWGYKGVTLRLIRSILKDWGSECIVFFNYNRINPALSNPVSKDHMDRPIRQRKM
jgi:three-Cys-motif partner protein